MLRRWARAAAVAALTVPPALLVLLVLCTPALRSAKTRTQHISRAPSVPRRTCTHIQRAQPKCYGCVPSCSQRFVHSAAPVPLIFGCHVAEMWLYSLLRAHHARSLQGAAVFFRPAALRQPS
ncbi:hypothetical protein EON67_06970 [archaeon]|nr:MAG: hypothetical protein EON67_06970 [archaeon]